MRTMRGLLFIGDIPMGKILKKHLSISGQIEKLQKRGLIIEDAEFAGKFLERVNYYRFTGYLHDFRKPNSDSYQIENHHLCHF